MQKNYKKKLGQDRFELQAYEIFDLRNPLGQKIFLCHREFSAKIFGRNFYRAYQTRALAKSKKV